jgi:hypothetical protein
MSDVILETHSLTKEFKGFTAVNERMTPRRAICAGCSRVMSCPLKRMVPDVGVRNFVSRLKHVVLPAPLGPISAWMEPRRTARFTSLTAVKPLNSLVRLWVSRMTSLIAPGSLRWVLGKEALRQGLHACVFVAVHRMPPHPAVDTGTNAYV